MTPKNNNLFKNETTIKKRCVSNFCFELFSIRNFSTLHLMNWLTSNANGG